MTMLRHGGCKCGAVRLEIHGDPKRVGLCHCVTCRRETGSPFMAFGVWDRSQISIVGGTRSWIDTTDHRHYCPTCGSRLFATHDGDDEMEVRLGCLDDAPSDLSPNYELWIVRREHWLRPVAGAVQHEANRPTN